jgi:hypothetical protein
MVAFPAAASAIAVGAAAIGTVAMCDEHFGLNLMPWERDNVPFSEMSPEQQNRSIGALGGGLAGGLLAGVVTGGPKGTGRSFEVPRLPEFGLFEPAFEGGYGSVPAARPAVITTPVASAPGAVAAAPAMMAASGTSSGGGDDQSGKKSRRQDSDAPSKEAAVKEAKERAGDKDQPDWVDIKDPQTGETIGRKSPDGKQEWRIDPAHTDLPPSEPASQRPHVNWKDWSKGKKNGSYGHVFF